MSAPNSVLRWADAVRALLKRGNYPALTVEVVLAIIWQESTGNPFAYNPEPRYRYLWNVKIDAPFRKLSEIELASKTPPADFPALAGDRDQEWWAQQASWGLMQLMGAAAREQRFLGGYLTELTDPGVNIEFGARHLWNYAFQYGNRKLDDALLRWNGGGDAQYPAKVTAKMAEITQTK